MPKTDEERRASLRAKLKTLTPERLKLLKEELQEGGELPDSDVMKTLNTVMQELRNVKKHVGMPDDGDGAPAPKPKPVPAGKSWLGDLLSDLSGE